MPDLSTLIALCDLPERLPTCKGKRVQMNTLHRWRLSGRLPCLKIGRRWYVTPETLAALAQPGDGPPTRRRGPRPLSTEEDHRQALEHLRGQGFKV